MDGDGCENVASKVNLSCFKLYRAYFTYAYGQNNVGSFFLELNSKKLYRSSRKEKKVVVAFSCRFHVVVVQ